VLQAQFELQRLAFVALGSNLGDSRRLVLQAMDRVQALAGFPILRSSLWQTTPVDCPAGSPMFVNAAVGLLPCQEETPESLLDKLQSLEREFGRQPKGVANEPRPIDLDLIAFGREVRATGRLTLPHPRATQRRFVLQPLSEIAAGLVLPGQVLTVQQLLETLDSPERIARLV
jgi:2-amino-4-hydroxy-6-hydroxymethyldihydropteridine diphosphokinase